ncbi:MAG: ATP-binding protein, partial [Bacteroidota bacterium]
LKSRVERLDNFIDGLLEYSRVGRMNLDLEQVDLDIMINDIVRSFDNESVTIQKSGTFPVIKGYKVLIHQLFQNLISNAIKHNDKSQRLVHLKYDLHGDSHIFYVKDNGPGIRPELREKVFKIFQTLKPKDEQESTGIGLSIVKKIIEEIKGEIEVCDSDEGALIKFSIPTSVDKPFPIL